MKSFGRVAARRLWNATPDPLHVIVYGKYPIRMLFWKWILKVVVSGQKPLISR